MIAALRRPPLVSPATGLHYDTGHVLLGGKKQKVQWLWVNTCKPKKWDWDLSWFFMGFLIVIQWDLSWFFMGFLIVIQRDL